MRILLITQWFDPEPTFKGMLFAQELRRRGHEVQVLTGFPNYPGGKLYPGFRIKAYQREVIDGVTVLRVPLYPSHDQSGLKRALNYLSFATTATLGALLMERPDVAYVYHPPATVGLPAMILQALKGVPFVYDVQDLWPDTLAATGMMERQAVLGAVDSLMRRIYRKAAHVVVLSEGFKQRLTERGVPERKVTVIPNWTDENQISLQEPKPARAMELGFTDRFNVVFAGTMGKAQALDTVLDAAAQLEDEPMARFVMIGGGIEVDRLKESAKQRALKNVVFLPRRPPSEIGEILSLADALLVHLKDDPLFAITIPSKTQAYMRTGRPILMGVRGDASRMVQEAGAGLPFTPQDASSLAEAVRKLMQLSAQERTKMGESGRRYYDEHLSLRVGVDGFEAVFHHAAMSGSSYEPLKRILDIALATAALVVAGLPMVLLMALVRVRLGSPVLFRQERPGRYGQPFTMYKLRTMTDSKDADGRPLPDAQRLTPFGRMLRSTSLDELPALFSVLRGDMSLVGPRPLLMEYLDRYTPQQARRHDVRPGITGWAQVNGRNAISWEEKFAHDVWYVGKRSLKLDIKIIMMTIRKVLERSDINADGDATMPRFEGS